MVPRADTVHGQGAMVVHFHYAGLTHRAVVCTVRLPLILITFLADFVVIRVYKSCLPSSVENSDLSVACDKVRHDHHWEQKDHWDVENKFVVVTRQLGTEQLVLIFSLGFIVELRVSFFFGGKLPWSRLGHWIGYRTMRSRRVFGGGGAPTFWDRNARACAQPGCWARQVWIEVPQNVGGFGRQLKRLDLFHYLYSVVPKFEL